MTKDDFCCQTVPPGSDTFCTNEPTHDVETNYGFLGSVCDEHWTQVVEVLRPKEPVDA